LQSGSDNAELQNGYTCESDRLLACHRQGCRFGGPRLFLLDEVSSMRAVDAGGDDVSDTQQQSRELSPTYFDDMFLLADVRQTRWKKRRGSTFAGWD
jgi:hypothetical protein